MLTITDIQARKLLTPLYSVAEKDKNDVIANAASALAVRLETAKRQYVLTDLDRRVAQYALTSQPQPEADTKQRRNTYKRRVSLV